MKCRFCGYEGGFYTKIKGYQYYTEDGEPCGFDVETQGNSVYCQDCNKRVCSVGELYALNEQKEAKENASGS